MTHSYKIGDQVLYPEVDRCPFEVVGIRKDEIEIEGDFSGGVAGPPHNKERDWVKPEEVKPYVEERPDRFKGMCPCQRMQIEHKESMNLLREVVAAVNNGQPIGAENFKDAMAFVYREGWGDCFIWSGEIPGETTRKEFMELLGIERHGRN